MWTVLIAGMAGIVVASGSDGAGLPFFELTHIELPIIGLKLQWFGILVAAGVLTGAHCGRKYGDRHGIDDEDLRGMTAWVVVSGFVGAHVFDVMAYQTDKMIKDPILLLKLWQGISSYGGFIGGAMGFAFFTWWKRLKPGQWADLTVIGLLSGFSVGRIGCTIVHDHMGRTTDYWTGTDYPRKELIERGLLDAYPNAGEITRIHNLGMYELIYLIPVNALIMWLAFRKKQSPAGLLAVLLGLLYAPVRFFMEFLRLNETDPRYLGMTFAQWSSIVAFLAAVGFLVIVIKRGKPAVLATALGPKEVGGRLDAGPRISKKHLADLDREEREAKAKEKEKDREMMRGKPAAKAKAKAEPEPEPESAAAAEVDGDPEATVESKPDVEAKVEAKAKAKEAPKHKKKK